MSLCSESSRVSPHLWSKRQSPYNGLTEATQFHLPLRLWLHLRPVSPHLVFTGVVCLSSDVPSTVSPHGGRSCYFLRLPGTHVTCQHGFLPFFFQVSAQMTPGQRWPSLPSAPTTPFRLPYLSDSVFYFSPQYFSLFDTFHIFLSLSCFFFFLISHLSYLECKLQNGQESVHSHFPWT